MRKVEAQHKYKENKSYDERKAKTDSNAYLFDLNDNRLELVKEYKYLGLTVTSNGKLNYAAEILAQKARKAFLGLKANTGYTKMYH